jgi:hypothetical protein
MQKILYGGKVQILQSSKDEIKFYHTGDINFSGVLFCQTYKKLTLMNYFFLICSLSFATKTKSKI